MTLLGVLIALVLTRLAPPSPHPSTPLRQTLADYCTRVLAHLTAARWQGPWGVLAVTTPLLVIMGIVQVWLEGSIYGLPSLALGVAVLFYVLGPIDLDADAEDSLHALEDHDMAAAQRIVEPWADHSGQADMTHALLAASLDRLLAPLFWFAILGPLGALWYRLATTLPRLPETSADFRHAAQRLHAILDYIPARLTALSYALAGHFEDTLQAYRAGTSLTLDTDSADLLVRCGRAAASLPLTMDDATPAPSNQHTLAAALELTRRALKIWIAVIALITLAGWVS